MDFRGVSEKIEEVDYSGILGYSAVRICIGFFIFLLFFACSKKYSLVNHEDIDQNFVAQILTMTGNMMLVCESKDAWGMPNEKMVTSALFQEYTDKNRQKLCSDTNNRFGTFRYASFHEAIRSKKEDDPIFYRFKAYFTKSEDIEMRVSVLENRKISEIRILPWKEENSAD